MSRERHFRPPQNPRAWLALVALAAACVGLGVAGLLAAAPA